MGCGYEHVFHAQSPVMNTCARCGTARLKGSGTKDCAYRKVPLDSCFSGHRQGWAVAAWRQRLSPEALGAVESQPGPWLLLPLAPLRAHSSGHAGSAAFLLPVVPESVELCVDIFTTLSGVSSPRVLLAPFYKLWQEA